MVNKDAAGLLPNDRPFTELEALNSFELDRNGCKNWSYRGYAKLWDWTVPRACRFIDAILSDSGLKRIGRRVLKNPVHTCKNNINQRDSNVTAALHPNPLKTDLDSGQRDSSVTAALHTADTKTETKTYCPEPCSVQEVKIPLKDGSSWTVPSDYINELQSTFPSLDVEAELLIIRQWNADNPSKRKTKGGIRRHISSWLNRKRTDWTSDQKGKIPDCLTCQYYENGDCPNLQKPGYPALCKSHRSIAN